MRRREFVSMGLAAAASMLLPTPAEPTPAEPTPFDKAIAKADRDVWLFRCGADGKLSRISWADQRKGDAILAYYLPQTADPEVFTAKFEGWFVTGDACHVQSGDEPVACVDTAEWSEGPLTIDEIVEVWEVMHRDEGARRWQS